MKFRSGAHGLRSLVDIEERRGERSANFALNVFVLMRFHCIIMDRLGSSNCVFLL